MTGRPTCISVNMCSSPFPLPFEETELEGPSAASLLNDPDLRNKRINTAMSSPRLRNAPFSNFGSEEDILAARSWLHTLPVNAGLYLLYSCDLTVVMQELLDRIYSANSVHQHWRSLQTGIKELQARVDVWLSSLPPGLDFTHAEHSEQAHGLKMALEFQYHSAQIMLGRPCLCRHNIPKRGPDDEQQFTHAMAVSALRSATQMANLIQDGPSTGSSHGAGPWWCLLHYVMQAATVMILELAMNCIHTPHAESNLLHLTRKCVRWLQRTSEHSIASHRAWQLCDGALRRLELPTGLDISDLSLYFEQQGRQERHAQPVNAEMHHQPIPEESATGYVGETSATQPISLGYHSSTSGNMLNSSAAVAHGMSEHFSAYDPVSEEFARFIFPEFENKKSWID